MVCTGGGESEAWENIPNLTPRAREHLLPWRAVSVQRIVGDERLRTSVGVTKYSSGFGWHYGKCGGEL